LRRLAREVPRMAEPCDGMAAGVGDRPHLRASHAEREQVIGLLKAAFVEERLAKDEFDLRVGQVLTSRTSSRRRRSRNGATRRRPRRL
jgi:hypothetical protein